MLHESELDKEPVQPDIAETNVNFEEDSFRILVAHYVNSYFNKHSEDFEKGLDLEQICQALEVIWPSLQSNHKEYKKSELTDFFDNYMKNWQGNIEKRDFVDFICNFNKYLTGGDNFETKSPFFKQSSLLPLKSILKPSKS